MDMIIYTDSLLIAALAASYWRMKGARTTIIGNGEGYDVMVSYVGLDLVT